MNKSPYLLFKAAIFIIILLIAIGTCFFRFSENWNWIDSFYFTTMTVTTVGYGDLVPSHDISKIITALYGLISIPIFIFAFSGIVEIYTEKRMNRLERKLRQILKIEEEIDEVIEQERGSHKPSSFLKRWLGMKS